MVARTSEMMMEGKRLIHELQQGKELANRLMNNLNRPSSQKINQSLISEILCSYEKAILLLNSGSSPAEQSKGTINRTERLSPDMDFKNVLKKRKISEKESEKVKICVGKGQDGGCIEDGYCWRKYGQKEILGSKNPRGYYRCTHRFTQGCLAVKQVQRSDTDPSVFEVKYLGTHKCDVTPASAATHVSVPKTEHKAYDTEQIHDIMNSPMISEDMMVNLDDLEDQKVIFRTFSFSKAEPEKTEWKNEIFLENFSPGNSGSGITTSELISAPTSVANSPTGDSYLSSLDSIINFDTDFSFDSYLDLLS